MPEVPRGPANRPAPPDRNPARVLAVAGVTGLAIVLIVVLALIGSAGGGGAPRREAAATPTATRTPKPRRTPRPSPTPAPSPTPTPLAPAQERERQAAVDVVRGQGFEVVRMRDYDPAATLRVLIGRSPSGEMAFFFVNGDYLGNDSSDLSAKLRVEGTGDFVVMLSYGIFQPGDPPDMPTGQPATVEFRYDGATVEPVEPLPDPAQRTSGRQTG